MRLAMTTLAAAANSWLRSRRWWNCPSDTLSCSRPLESRLAAGTGSVNEVGGAGGLVIMDQCYKWDFLGAASCINLHEQIFVCDD